MKILSTITDKEVVGGKVKEIVESGGGVENKEEIKDKSWVAK